MSNEVMTLESPVPFGKYKDQPVAVMMGDQQYVNWCLMQTWFAEKHQALAAVLQGRNTLEQDACTPEHNSLQMLFLKPEYQTALVLRVLDLPKDYAGNTHAQNLLNEHIEASINVAADTEHIANKILAYEPRPYTYDRRELNSKWLAQAVLRHGVDLPAIELELRQRAETEPPEYSAERAEEFCRCAKNQLYTASNYASTDSETHRVKRLDKLRQQLDTLPEACRTLTGVTQHWTSAIEFEANNWDLVLPATGIKYSCSCGAEVARRGGNELYNSYYIELKPSISEDYPAILRKVKSRASYLYRGAYYGGKVVITREITAATATVEEIKAMFKMSGVELFLLSEIEELI